MASFSCSGSSLTALDTPIWKGSMGLQVAFIKFLWTDFCWAFYYEQRPMFVVICSSLRNPREDFSTLNFELQFHCGFQKIVTIITCLVEICLVEICFLYAACPPLLLPAQTLTFFGELLLPMLWFCWSSRIYTCWHWKTIFTLHLWKSQRKQQRMFTLSWSHQISYSRPWAYSLCSGFFLWFMSELNFHFYLSCSKLGFCHLQPKESYYHPCLPWSVIVLGR